MPNNFDISYFSPTKKISLPPLLQINTQKTLSYRDPLLSPFERKLAGESPKKIKKFVTSIQVTINQTPINTSKLKPDLNVSDSDSDKNNKIKLYEEKTPTVYDSRSILNEETAPIFRDSEENYKVLERLFGTMNVGMAFGETSFLNFNDNKVRFYNAIALSDCVVLTLSRKDFFHVLETQEKKS